MHPQKNIGVVQSYMIQMSVKIMVRESLFFAVFFLAFDWENGTAKFMIFNAMNFIPSWFSVLMLAVFFIVLQSSCIIDAQQQKR